MSLQNADNGQTSETLRTMGLWIGQGKQQVGQLYGCFRGPLAVAECRGAH
jgi:hypothetical protein